MNGIDIKNLSHIAQPLKSKSSYLQANKQSFEKVMKNSQSLQTVQPKDKNQIAKLSNGNSNLSKLEAVIEKLNEKLDEMDESNKDDLNGVIDLLSMLQSMIQQQLEAFTQSPDNNRESTDNAALTIPESVLLTDSKSFMDTILSAINPNQNGLNLESKNSGEELSALLSNILSKMKDVLKVDRNDEEAPKITISKDDMNKFLNVLSQFLEDKGLNKNQIQHLTENMTKLVSKIPMNGESKTDVQSSLKPSSENEIESIPTIKLNSTETDQQTAFSNQAFAGDTIKQYALFVGKTTNKATANQFVRDFQNIIQKSNFTNEMGQQKIFIKLFPENLGRISIELVKNEHGMMATIIASSAKAKELLQSNMDSLKQSFQMNNLQVEKIDLYQSLQADRSNSYLNQEREDQKHQQQQSKNQSKQQSNSDEEFSSSFLDEMMKVSL
ncbi:flagellar hook-length control protein FliK [Gottfriedia luciferensis]|uniref:flagellar hook-length control protein FliK n=1 Tax=Gottfriedia luciferensis TaxID=178774 RepID=UPI000B44A8CC|nr:flagellar hook-length control protein FliK [Gottfriedia luciferensis]